MPAVQTEEREEEAEILEDSEFGPLSISKLEVSKKVKKNPIFNSCVNFLICYESFLTLLFTNLGTWNQRSRCQKIT
jgi:hypothetical protein